MWKAVESPVNQEPWNWLRLPSTDKFLKALCKKLNLELSQVLKKTPGRCGGTFGHYQIAMAYAQYLDPEFGIWCNEVVKNRFELMTESNANA